MAVQNMTISVQPDVRARLEAESTATGRKMTAIIQEALRDRWEAKDAEAA